MSSNCIYFGFNEFKVHNSTVKDSFMTGLNKERADDICFRANIILSSKVEGYFKVVQHYQSLMEDNNDFNRNNEWNDALDLYYKACKFHSSEIMLNLRDKYPELLF